MSSTMSGSSPTIVNPVAEVTYTSTRNTEHRTRNTPKLSNSSNFQTLQNPPNPQRGTRNTEHGTLLDLLYLQFYILFTLKGKYTRDSTEMTHI